MKKTLFKLHYYSALAALIPLLIILVTGSILVFKFEIDALLMPEAATLSHKNQPRENINSSIASINQALPEYEIGSWEIFDDGYEADRVYLIKKGTHSWYKIYFDPFENVVLSIPVPLNHDITDWLLELHYTLTLNNLFTSAPHLGVIVGLLCAVILSFLGISGLLIYKNFWKKLFTLKWHHKPIIVTRRLHRLIGIWSSPVLLAVGITGIYFNLVAYAEELKDHDEGEHIMQQRLYNDKLDIQRMLNDSSQQMSDFTPTYILFPTEPAANFTLYGHLPNANPLASQYGSTVSFDAHNGQHLKNYDLRKTGIGWQVIDSFRTLHFGNFAGISSKLIWCIGSLGLVFLAFSGVYMWLKRHSAKASKQRKRKLQSLKARKITSSDSGEAVSVST